MEPLAVHQKVISSHSSGRTVPLEYLEPCRAPFADNGDEPLKVIARAPLVVLYNWGNLLIFDLANQRTPESAEEDRINKPHRPLPTGRMTPLQARRLLLASLPVVLTINYFLGPWIETALLFTLTWMYNDLGGGDEGAFEHS